VSDPRLSFQPLAIDQSEQLRGFGIDSGCAAEDLLGWSGAVEEFAADMRAREVVFIYRLVDGRIAERWAVRNDLGMMRQLGALPPE
jgi:hypothetical protein